MKEVNNLAVSGQFQPSGFPEPEKFGAPSLSEDVTETVFSKGIRSIGTSAEQLPLGEVVTPSRVWVRNYGTFPCQLNDTGSGTFNVVCNGGSQVYLGWNGAAVWIKAIGGASQVKFFILGA